MMRVCAAMAQKERELISERTRAALAAASPRPTSSLDKLSDLIAWTRIASLLEPFYPASKGEPAWPPLAMFKALLLAVWYDLSDVKLAEALEDRASFRRFSGFRAASRRRSAPPLCASAGP
jgi:hypothetical protein